MHYSTDATLDKAINDLLIPSEEGLIHVRVLLELSPAFDTFKHHILLQRLEHLIGIKGQSH